ncbi:MAG: pyridine nucleotide-disulfide oxidoreductase [Gammaproteobacteria bacterium]|nr:pyridine nucleotide-disulfide oxidoreductase [Gammaproteobacteria bacterium]
MSWYIGLALAVVAGWMLREQRYLVAETGIGYWLGIFGGTMMLLMLVYPLRKRKPRWRFLGSVKFWFRFHMLLGVLGPVLVIFHSGYRLGSLNGQVAFFSMIIVSLSGLVGRYLYRSIHHGLYGEKIRFEELYHQNENWEKVLNLINQERPEIAGQLRELEEKLVNRHTGFNRSYWFYRSTRRGVDRLYRNIRVQLAKSKLRTAMLDRLTSLRQICNLGINEILFSYWHILHFPLFIMLVLSGITHVAVVHFY